MTETGVIAMYIRERERERERERWELSMFEGERERGERAFMAVRGREREEGGRWQLQKIHIQTHKHFPKETQ